MAAEMNSSALPLLAEVCEISAIYHPSWRSYKLFLEGHPVWGLCVTFDANLNGAFIPHSLFSSGMKDNKL